MGQSKTAAALVGGREREARAFELRRSGLSYRAIGRELGISEAGAHAAVTRVLRRLSEKLAEDVPAVRRLELERLDHLLARLEAGIAVGDPGAITTALRIAERRAKITGIDAPTRTAIGGDAEGVPIAMQAHDLTKLSDDELATLRGLVAKIERDDDTA